MSGSLRRLAQWGADLAFSDIPADTIEAAKSQVFSTLAAAHAGYRSDLGAPIRKAFGAPAGIGAHALPAGIATSPGHAAFLMAAWSVVLDFDDIMLGGHTGHSSVLVPLAYVESKAGSGSDLLLAQITANEIAARVNMAVALGSARGQMAGHVHLLGAAAARAKLERLDGERFAESLGFALSQPTRALYPGFLGSDAKTLCAAWPLRMGLEAVDAVQAGLHGNAEILDEPRGFLDTFAKVPVREFLDGLGERWHTATNSIKIYPACGYLSSVLDATLSLVRRHDIDAKAVEAVEVRGSIFTVGMDAHSAPYLREGDSLISTLTFSTPYTVACAILDRQLSADHLRRDRIRDPRVWELARKVRVMHDMQHTVDSLVADIPLGAAIKCAPHMGVLRFLLSMGGTSLVGKLLLSNPIGFVRLVRALTQVAGRADQLDFSRSTKRLSATVIIRMRGGQVFEESVAIPRGFAGSGDARSLRGLAREKYCAQAAPLIGRETALHASALIDNLENLRPADIRNLVQLNCAPPKSDSSQRMVLVSDGA
jgi:2-methylcitrate dehydratase PrpD